MDYDIINQVIEEILGIVNRYNRKHGYSVELMEDLVVTLLGYYLVFGADLFKNIDKLLCDLEIHFCAGEEKYKETISNILPNFIVNEVSPIMIYDYKYRKDGKFIGAIPHIVLTLNTRKGGVFDLIHEFSHALEGVMADIQEDTREKFVFKQGFATFNIQKDINFGPIDNAMFMELLTACIESKIVNALKDLDYQKIDNQFVSWFIRYIKENDKKVVTGSYLNLEMLYKDLFDNDVFFEMIKKYHYQNESELFEEEFDSYTNGKVKLRDLISMANTFNINEPMGAIKHQALIQDKIRTFNKATNFEPSKSLILLI